MSEEKKPEAKPEPRTLQQRLTHLETVISQHEEALTKSMQMLFQMAQSVEQKLGTMADDAARAKFYIQALTKLVDQQQVVESVSQMVSDTYGEATKSEDEVIKQGIEAGYVSVLDVATEDSIVSGEVRDKNGAYVPPIKLRIPVAKLSAQVRTETLGKGAGYAITTEAGDVFTITDIYKVDAEKYREHLNKKSAEAAEKIQAQDQAQDNEAASSPPMETTGQDPNAKDLQTAPEGQ